MILPGTPGWQNTSSNNDSSSCFDVRVYYPSTSDCGCQSEAQCFSSDYVCYKGPNLPNTGINTDDSLTLALEKIDNFIAEAGQVPNSRTLTINGTSYDLSANRTWSVGVVTSITAGTSISVGGTSAVPIVTNTAPDQTVVLTQGSGVTITGTYPNFTISATGSGGTVTSVGATSPITSSGGATPTISTSIATNKLVGRYSAGTGVMQEITIGSGLSLSGAGTLSSSAISGLTTGRIPYATSSSTLGDDLGLTWASSYNVLTITASAGNAIRIFGPATGSIFIGDGAGNVVSTGSDSICIGKNSGSSLAAGSGSSNILVGANTGNQFTTGGANVVIGTNNLQNSTASSLNVLLGDRIMTNSTSGDENIVIGPQSAQDLTGDRNIIIGNQIDPQSNSGDDQLVIQNAIFGSGNAGAGTTISSGNIGFWSNSWGTSAVKVISIGSGTAPTTSPADSFQFYSKDVVAGNASPHFKTETGDVVKLYKYIDAAFGNTVNTGDANTDALINALVSALTAHGLIATS